MHIIIIIIIVVENNVVVVENTSIKLTKISIYFGWLGVSPDSDDQMDI